MCGGYRSGACEEEQERCLSYPGCQWWHCSGAAPESCGSAEAWGARGDLAGYCRRSVDAADRTRPSTIALNCQSGDQASWRLQRLPRRRGRSARLGAGVAPEACRLARHGRLRWRVAHKLALQRSPEQIAGWLKRQLPTDQGMQISHETIYRSLFIQTRGVLKKQLMA